MCNRIIASVLAIVIGVFSFAVTAQESPKAAPVSEVQKESVSATEEAMPTPPRQLPVAK